MGVVQLSAVLTTVGALKRATAHTVRALGYEPHYTLPVTILSQLQSSNEICDCVYMRLYGTNYHS